MRLSLRVAFLLTAVVIICSGCEGRAHDGVDAVRERGTICIAVPDDGERDGEDVEKRVAEALAARLGVSIRYETVESSQLEDLVKQGGADIAAGIPVESDARKTNSSVTYGRRPLFLVTDENTYITGMSDFTDSTVGFSSTLNPDEKNRFYPVMGISLEEYQENNRAADDIRSGKIKAYACGRQEAREFLENGGLAVQDMCGTPGQVYTFMTGDGETRLLSIINELLTSELAD